MRYSLETKIQIVILMAKFESPVMVIRELQRQGVTDIPTRPEVQNLSRARPRGRRNFGKLSHWGNFLTIYMCTHIVQVELSRIYTHVGDIQATHLGSFQLLHIRFFPTCYV